MATSRYGKPGASLSAEIQKQVLELCEQGVTRNDIARQLKIGAASVSGIVARAGLSFDRTAIEAATKARRADLRARRALLASELLDDAFRLRQQIWEPHKYIDHGGKDFTAAEWEQPEPSPIDKLKLMQAAGTALGRHLDLEKHDADNQSADARSMLGQIADVLGVQKPDA